MTAALDEVRPSVTELARLLVSAAGGAASAAGQLTEHFTDMSDSDRKLRLPEGAVDGLASALNSTLLVEIEAVDEDIRLLGTRNPMSANATAILIEQRAGLNQLTGALARFLDDGI